MPCSVSVVVPAYNCAATLPDAVRSVLAQDVHDLEILIVDDGSLDATADVAASLAQTDDRIRLISLPANRGKPYAMNLATEEARGAWVAVLDADDWFAPSRLSTLLNAGAQAAADFVADNQFFYDAGAAQVVRNAFSPGSGDRILDKAEFIAGNNPYAEFDYGMLKPMVRMDFLRRTGVRYRETAQLSEDFLFMVECFAAGANGFLVAQPLYYWRQAFGSVSRAWTETGNGSWRYDFSSAADATAELLNTLQAQNEPELAAMLERRVRAFRRLGFAQDISRMYAGGTPISRLVPRIMAYPASWPLMARSGFRLARRKFRKLRTRNRSLTG